MFIVRPAKIIKVQNSVGPGQWMAGFKYAPLPCTVKYNSAFKKQEVWSLATLWMNLEDNLINGLNQVQREEDRLMFYGKTIRNREERNLQRLGEGQQHSAG